MEPPDFGLGKLVPLNHCHNPADDDVDVAVGVGNADVQPALVDSGPKLFLNDSMKLLTNVRCMNCQTIFRQAPIAGVLLLSCITQASAQVRWPAEAVVRFSATSTLHDFGGDVPAQPFVLTVSSNAWSAEADVLSGLMATGSDGRDKNMYRMLNTNDHPLLHGQITAAPKPAAGSTNVTLSLKISGQQHDLPVQISNWNETGDRLSFHAEWDLSLKQFKLKPPSVIGIIRVGDLVHLSADVTASKSPASTNLPAASNVPANKQ